MRPAGLATEPVLVDSKQLVDKRQATLPRLSCRRPVLRPSASCRHQHHLADTRSHPGRAGATHMGRKLEGRLWREAGSDHEGDEELSNHSI